jgi:MFS transporter, DHA2 family, multidrug resistance protein
MDAKTDTAPPRRTIIARSTQVHQNYLVANLAPSSPAYQHTMTSVTAALTAQGVPAANASMAATAYLGQIVAQQATLLACMDVFRDFAMVALLMAPVALILLRSQTPRVVAAH